MVWAAIGTSIDKTELEIMVRDDDSRQGGFSSVSYVEMLERGLVPIYGGQIFQHDNAPIHTLAATTIALQN